MSFSLLSVLEVDIKELCISIHYSSRSAYSEGDTPKCLRKMVEKWARLEKPTV